MPAGMARAARCQPDLSFGAILTMTWPIIVANAAGPILGLVDTAVIGNQGDVESLGAIALGSLVFNFIAWTFGFLRMGTTGLVAQAEGRGDGLEIRATLGRAMCLGLAVSCLLLVLQQPIIEFSLWVLDASPNVAATARAYLRVRLWGTPASLPLLGVLGTLIGLGESRRLLFVQVVLNVVNIALDLLFAAKLGWGAWGVALGTALSQWVALGLGFWLVVDVLRKRNAENAPFWPWERIRDIRQLFDTLRIHRDIMLRTMLLLFGFMWFVRQSAQFGDETLAANHVLLQFVSFSAFFLDGFAHVAESLTGQALGSGDRERFDTVVRRSTILAVVTAIGLAIAIFVVGPWGVRRLTDLSDVRAIAEQRVWFAAVYVLVAVWAFQLDGIFIGATRSVAMRNASLFAVSFFVACAIPLANAFGNAGLWTAFIGYAAARAISLGVLLPGLRKEAHRSE